LCCYWQVGLPVGVGVGAGVLLTAGDDAPLELALLTGGAGALVVGQAGNWYLPTVSVIA
jgi:hypothetical protein